MTMIYLQKSRPSKKKNFLFGLLVTIAIVLGVIGLKILFDGPLTRLTLNVGGPISSSFLSLQNRVSFVTSFFSSRATLEEENQRLKSQIEENQASLIRFKSLLSEHQTLLESYGRVFGAEEMILGNVIAKPPQSLYDVIIVDVGSRDGVVLGSRVYGLGGIPIGRVNESANSSAKVVLFTNPGEKSQVVNERTGLTFEVVGTGGGNFQAEVSQDMDIAIDDAILLPQFGGAVIATVVDIESNVTSAFKQVLLRLPVNVFNLRWVEIVKVPEI